MKKFKNVTFFGFDYKKTKKMVDSFEKIGIVLLAVQLILLVSVIMISKHI